MFASLNGVFLLLLPMSTNVIFHKAKIPEIGLDHTGQRSLHARSRIEQADPCMYQGTSGTKKLADAPNPKRFPWLIRFYLYVFVIRGLTLKSESFSHLEDIFVAPMLLFSSLYFVGQQMRNAAFRLSKS